MVFDKKKTLILLGVLVAAGAMTNQTPSKQPTQDEIAHKQEFSDSIDAQVAAKMYVQARLKAPSTAKWQDSADVAVSKVEGSKDRWLVNGFVDSQNSYGAMLRMRYWATVAKTSTGGWKVVKLQTEP